MAKRLEKYRKKYDIADWFRGTSTFQIEAADNLQNALRDDVEQNTTHRVRAILESLGLEPLMKNKPLRAVMKISKCNDLAFLYGIMVIFYKKKGSTGYSLNEQIIMSTIAHLDMITTLRELDRILPPGHISKQKQALIDKINARKEAALRRANRPRKQREPAILPYFEKLVRPKYHSRRLSCKMPDQSITIIPYERYLDPHYKVPNQNRWFASYSVRPSERIVRAIIDEEINKIFCDLECASQRANAMEIICEYHFQEYLNEIRRKNERLVQVREMFGGGNKKTMAEPNPIQKARRRKYIVDRLHHDVKANIDHNRKKQKAGKIFKIKVISDKSNVCEKLVEVGTNEPFFKMMDKDFPPCSPVESWADMPGHYLRPCPCSSKKCQDKQRYITPTCKCNEGRELKATQPYEYPTCAAKKKKKQKQNNRLTAGEELWKYIPDHRSVYKRTSCQTGQKCSQEREFDFIQSNRSDSKISRQDKIKLNYEDSRQITLITDGCKKSSNTDRLVGGKEYPLRCTPNHKPGARVISQPCKRLCTKGQLDEFYHRFVESDGETSSRSSIKSKELLNDDLSETESKVFFKAATKHTPHYFDYERIYRFSSTDIRNKIKKMFIKALDEQHVVPAEWEGHPNVIGAAAYNFHKLFKEGVVQKTKEIEQEEKEQDEEVQVSPTDPEYGPKIMRKKYPQSYFDANDTVLMDNMLKDAMKVLKKNPYYVLASLPDSHKLPMLREWIYKRYGKVYTKDDRIAFLKEASNTFQQLTKENMNVKFPKGGEIKAPPNMTYKQRDKLMEKFNALQQQVMESMDSIIMETSRNFWFALSPYILPKGPPRNTYFAYMPARVRDIQHFRLWQPGEYRDYKKLREKNQEEEDNE